MPDGVHLALIPSVLWWLMLYSI